MTIKAKIILFEAEAAPGCSRGENSVLDHRLAPEYKHLSKVVWGKNPKFSLPRGYKVGDTIDATYDV